MRDTKRYNRLNKVIFDTGMSTGDMARALGVGAKTVTRWRSFSPACPDIPEKQLIKLEQMAEEIKASRKAQQT